MKALSLWQPWASLWVSPSKIHETRHWATSHRRRLLVHAAKRPIPVNEFYGDTLGDICGDTFGLDWAKSLPLGAIVGMVDLTDCTPTEETWKREFDEGRMTDEILADLECGDFSDGRFGWRRGTYWVFDTPIPYRGRQAIFNVPDHIVAEQIATAREVIGG